MTTNDPPMDVDTGEMENEIKAIDEAEEIPSSSPTIYESKDTGDN